MKQFQTSLLLLTLCLLSIPAKTFCQTISFKGEISDLKELADAKNQEIIQAYIDFFSTLDTANIFSISKTRLLKKLIINWEQIILPEKYTNI